MRHFTKKHRNENNRVKGHQRANDKANKRGKLYRICRCDENEQDRNEKCQRYDYCTTNDSGSRLTEHERPDVREETSSYQDQKGSHNSTRPKVGKKEMAERMAEIMKFL